MWRRWLKPYLAEVIAAIHCVNPAIRFRYHSDGLLTPVIDELATIVDCSFDNPCIDQSVFGATAASSFYWSSSTQVGGSATGAWSYVFFLGGPLNLFAKDNVIQVRAVRGGS